MFVECFRANVSWKDYSSALIFGVVNTAGDKFEFSSCIQNIFLKRIQNKNKGVHAKIEIVYQVNNNTDYTVNIQSVDHDKFWQWLLKIFWAFMYIFLLAQFNFVRITNVEKQVLLAWIDVTRLSSIL